jgi:hypothetical protein
MRSIDAAPMPIAVGIVRKIPVHLMLLSKAEVKTGSAQIARKIIEANPRRRRSSVPFDEGHADRQESGD